MKISRVDNITHSLETIVPLIEKENQVLNLNVSQENIDASLQRELSHPDLMQDNSELSAELIFKHGNKDTDMNNAPTEV